MKKNLSFLAIFFLLCACQSPPNQQAVTPESKTPEKTIKTVDVTEVTKPSVKVSEKAKPAPAIYKHPRIKIITAKGTMIAELYEDKVPNTVANIITLAEKGFYKDLCFHRVLKDFMAQGGCPNSKKNSGLRPGTGGPGYTFDNEINTKLRHSGRGILSMANAGPNTNGSQFFILFKPVHMLDGGYSVFGKIVAGLDVLDKLEAIGAKRDPLPPLEEVYFSIEVISKNNHVYKVKKNQILN